MEDFKKQMIGRQLILTSGLLAACSALILSRNYRKMPSVSDSVSGFVDGFQVGVILGLVGFMVYFLVRNVIAMGDPERLKKLHITETDERKLWIMQKSGSAGMNFIMYGMGVGTAVAGNFNDLVFFTLLGTTLFVSLVRASLKLYYRNKY